MQELIISRRIEINKFIGLLYGDTRIETTLYNSTVKLLNIKKLCNRQGASSKTTKSFIERVETRASRATKVDLK